MAPGTRIAIMGPSGSGKSTLLACIAGLENPDSGEIYFKNSALHQLDAEKSAPLRKKEISSIFQFFHLLPTLNAYENVEFPLLLLRVPSKARRERVNTLLEEVGMDHRKRSFPETLSGGELQRLAIARALIVEPSLLLADEPTGSLDAANSLKILELLNQLTRQHSTALLMVTHDPEAAAICEKHLQLHEGRFQSNES